MRKIAKHTAQTLADCLAKKGPTGIVTIVRLNVSTAEVKDIKYGNYTVDLKSFCESSAFPKHKNRRHEEKMTAAAAKVIGKTVGGFLITSLFYGPDRGYKNRSFYVEFVASCGHQAISTLAHLKKHKSPDSTCKECLGLTHGARAKKDGIRIKRTTTYVHWQRTHPMLPGFLKSFEDFRRVLGDKPYARAEVIVDGDTARWSPLEITNDKEINLIATAIRQAFRHSYIYKNAVDTVKIETVDGTRYRCADCGELAKRSNIQVDHINPIQPIDGSKLKKEDLIDRIWTDKIQILDRTCHSKKSTIENQERRRHKREKT